jgi:hypothetical protein
MAETNYFQELYKVDVSSKIEKKGNLSYVSWPFAWAELKKLHPDAIYTIYENADGWNYHTDGKTAWVKTGVTVNGIEHIEYLPVMDFRNNSIPADKVTSTDVNKTIQRSLTKAVARHGLGLYIYAGEDLPEDLRSEEEKKFDKKVERDKASKISKADQEILKGVCEKKGLKVDEVFNKPLAELTGEEYVVALQKLNNLGKK